MSRTVEQVRLDQNFVASKAGFGFWVYLMTDLVLFASLFAVYAVLRNNTFGGPSGGQLFNFPTVLLETLLLLTSSFTSGLVSISVSRANKTMTYVFLALTFVLGASFLGLELHEFSGLIQDGHSWRESGFMSAFFTLVGTHGAHITIGLLWMVVMAFQIAKKGFTPNVVRKLTLFTMFWHFLDVVWIFIFSIVYMIGAL